MKINSHLIAYEILKKKMSLEVEEFWCLALTSDLKLIDSKMIARGTVDFCHVHPRDIFRFAYKKNASKLIIAHNHPSKNPNPSDGDLKMTEELLMASLILKVPILDHLIVTQKNYFSMAENKVGKFKDLFAT